MPPKYSKSKTSPAGVKKQHKKAKRSKGRRMSRSRSRSPSHRGRSRSASPLKRHDAAPAAELQAAAEFKMPAANQEEEIPVPKDEREGKEVPVRVETAVGDGPSTRGYRLVGNGAWRIVVWREGDKEATIVDIPSVEGKLTKPTSVYWDDPKSMGFA